MNKLWYWLLLATTIMAALRVWGIIGWSWAVILAPIYVPIVVMGVLCWIGLMIYANETWGGDDK